MFSSKTGKKPVKAIFKREDVFKGKHADTAPDILMEPNEGYSLTHAKSAIEDADWVSGDHRIEGTIVAVGPNVKPFETPPALIDRIDDPIRMAAFSIAPQTWPKCSKSVPEPMCMCKPVIDSLCLSKSVNTGMIARTSEVVKELSGRATRSKLGRCELLS
jgi:hypothetical protein